MPFRGWSVVSLPSGRIRFEEVLQSDAPAHDILVLVHEDQVVVLKEKRFGRTDPVVPHAERGDGSEVPVECPKRRGNRALKSLLAGFDVLLGEPILGAPSTAEVARNEFA